METKVSPSVLEWARIRSNIPIDELAIKLKTTIDKVMEWERDGIITLGRIKSMAKYAHVGMGYMFLQSPPDEMLPIDDFRTVDSEAVKPSSDLLDTVYYVMRRQNWFRSYVQANGGDKLDFVGGITQSCAINEAALYIRNALKWDTTNQLRSSRLTTRESLKWHVHVLEQAGILVMHNGIVNTDTHRKLSVDEFRGFTISDEYAPLIFLNSNDSYAAQIFTLAHEVVHLCLSSSGVVNLQKTRSVHSRIEKFCNAVAAEILVPEDEIRARWGDIRHSENMVQQFAAQFTVSTLVILRRLHDLDIINTQQFNVKYESELARLSKIEKPSKKEGQKGSGDYYQTQKSRIGVPFVSALIISTLEGTTPYREAFKMLGVSNDAMVRKFATYLWG